MAVGDNTRKNTAHRSSPLTLTTSVGSTPRRAMFQDLDTYCPMVSVTHLQGSQHLIFRTMFGVFINITAWASVNGNHDAEWAQGPGVPCCAMLGVNPWVGQGPDCQDSFTGRVRGSCPKVDISTDTIVPLGYNQWTSACVEVSTFLFCWINSSYFSFYFPQPRCLYFSKVQASL